MIPMTRQNILIAATSAVVLIAFVLMPALDRWADQSQRIAAIQKKVDAGRQMMAREKTLRARWAEMVQSDLADDNSAAESAIYQAIARWVREAQLPNPATLAGQWRSHDEGYDTYELRGVISGDQASLARLLYNIEAAPLPARVEDCEFTTKDAKGQQLTLAVRFSFVRLNETKTAAR